jgi:hypothetical protein
MEACCCCSLCALHDAVWCVSTKYASDQVLCIESSAGAGALVRARTANGFLGFDRLVLELLCER